jgi:poly(A) polymerase
MTQRTPSADSILAKVPFLDEVRQVAGERRTYLVGGAVRDAFLGLPTTDFDFVVPEPHNVAASVRRLVGGALVSLHEEFPTARLVIGQRGSPIGLDFAAPRAPSLRGDLQSRDFTINALGCGPINGRARLFDPCGGREDLARAIVRMTSPHSLIQDPLRILRAYRFMAQLGFRVERATRAQCRRSVELMGPMAAERIGAEMLALCGGDHFARALEAAFGDGVLATVLPELARAVGVEQLGVHEFDVATHSLLTIRRLSDVMRESSRMFPNHADQIGEYLSGRDTRAGLVLAGLLHDLGKPDCRVWEGGRWRFFGHEEKGVELGDEVTRRLRLPKRVRQQVALLIGSHMRLIPHIRTDEPTDRARRRLLRDTAPHTIGLVLLVIADWRALRTDVQVYDEEAPIARLRELLALARSMTDKGEAAEPLMTGKDLIRLGLEPGPLFREILDAVEEEWIAGNLNTASEALDWVRRRWARTAQEGESPATGGH